MRADGEEKSCLWRCPHAGISQERGRAASRSARGPNFGVINHVGVNFFAYPPNERLLRPFTQTGEASEERRRADLFGTRPDADCGSSVFKSQFLVNQVLPGVHSCWVPRQRLWESTEVNLIFNRCALCAAAQTRRIRIKCVYIVDKCQFSIFFFKRQNSD